MKLPFLSTALVALLLAIPTGAAAQAFFVDASLEQSFAPEPLSSPLGFSVAMGGTSLAGPFGVHAGLLEVYEDGVDELAQYCTFAGCTPGPFQQSYSLRIVYAGLSYDFRNSTDVYMNLGLNVGRTQQVEHLSHLTADDEIEVGPADQTTLGGSFALRLRPFLGPLRPVFSGRYDRLSESECPADGICVRARNMWSLSVGLSWVSPM